METQSKHAEVFLRDPSNGQELPFWRLKRTGLILARMDRPGPLLVEVSTTYPTMVTARIDGREVLKTDPMLTVGRHNLSAPALAIVPAGVSARCDDIVQLSEEDRYLEELGVVPDVAPTVVLPYIGEPGGVLKIKLAYFRFDNEKPFEFESDELIFKLNGPEGYLRAVAENVHRLVIEEDPDQAKHGHLCGMADYFDPQKNDH